ncbi:hypothetical protein BVRB_5g118740 [Beta vulgaris subsp. vulgaris]|nr:hypothetical protein BVRB_5g118740 [Beta vulgaris subsp. vulgaris]
MKSMSGEKLYLVVPVNGDVEGPIGAISLYFRFYELKSGCGRYSWVWEEVMSFGDDDQYASSTLQSEPLSCELEENGMIQSDSDGEGSVSLQDEVSPASRGPEREEQTTEIPSINAALAVTTRSPPVMNDMEHVAEEGRRKRLVVMVSTSGEKLYLVVPVNGDVKGPIGVINLYFRFYKLKTGCGRYSWVWEEVMSFGDDDQVMFVTRDYCFFVAAAEFSGCQLRNCIVFSEDAFPEYNVSKSGWDSGNQSENKVAVFSLDGRVRYSLPPVECYPGFPGMLCSPPPWVLQKTPSTLQSEPLKVLSYYLIDCELEENGMIQSDSDGEGSVSLQDEVSPASRGPEREEQTTEIPSINAALAVTTRSPPVMNDMEHVAEEVLETESLRNVIQIDSTAHLAQPCVKKVVTFKFRGIDVESEHLPVLQKIWMEHGDVVEGSAIRSCDTIAVALSSLAKMVLVLQTNSGDTLTDEQAHYLGSTLSDLQYMRLKVDWLTPFVEKVLMMHKSKQLQASLVELKAKTEEMEQKFLSDMAEMKQRLDKNIRLVSESIKVDHSKCLGEGLF